MDGAQTAIAFSAHDEGDRSLLIYSESENVASDSDSDHANMNLIKAAPKMLEALRGVKMHKIMFDDYEEFHAACNAVQKAINEAEGK
jgi:hypothetical protein